MKSSFLFVAASALLASASPIAEKRAPAPVKTVTEWVYATEVSTAYVTLAPGQEPPAEGQQPAQPAQFKEIKEPLRFNDVKDSHVPLPSNLFDEPSSDIIADIRPQYNPHRRPKPSARPQPKEPAPSAAPERTYGPTGPKIDDYAKSMLAKHNDARREHRVPALKWNDELAQAAKSSAQNCIQTHDNHGKGYGQNLAWLWTSDQGGSSTKVALGGVKSWYDEKKNFVNLYGVADPTSSNFNGIGHYTQMVWKATDEVGCATHRCSNSKVDWVTVCNYKKPGNVPGQFGEMVPQPS